MFRIVLALISLGLVSLPASAKTTCVQEPIPVVQMHAGAHLTFSGGKMGAGLSVDALGGFGYGSWCASMPGVTVGPFAEVNAVASEGTTFTWGGRGSAGTFYAGDVGYYPVAMAAFDYGKSHGARTGTRKGIRVHSFLFDTAYSWHEEGAAVITGGVRAPVLPFMANHVL